MLRSLKPHINRIVPRFLLAGLGIVVIGLAFTQLSYGDTLFQRSLRLSDNRAGATATYALGFTLTSAQVLGSIELQICSNSPLLTDPCTAPSGFDISGATLASQSGETGFVILPSGTNANTLTLSRVPVMANPGTESYELAGVVNPSSDAAYYGRIQTFSTADASGSNTDQGGLAFSINTQVQVTATVPPYLLFCSGITIGAFDCNNASGSYLNLGTLSNQSTASATSQLLLVTNATSGYALRVYGTTMTSGNNIIPALTAADASRPGVGQFGLNLVANSTPAIGQDPAGPGVAAPLAGYNTPDFFKFASGDMIASAAAADDYRKFTASYIINIPQGQPVGVYASTLTYTCLANF